MAALTDTDKLFFNGAHIESATQQQSSFEIKRTAKGEPTITVKVYVEDDEPAMRRKIRAAMAAGIATFYGAESKIAELEAMPDLFARAVESGALDEAVEKMTSEPGITADEVAVLVPVPEDMLEDHVNGDEAPLPDFDPPGKTKKPKRQKKSPILQKSPILPPKPTLEEAMADPTEPDDDDEFGEE